MTIVRLVTLDYACGSLITAHCLDELRHTVDRESLSRARLSVIEPGVILLELQDGMEAALDRIIECIQIFTNEFVSYVAFLSHEASEITSMLVGEARFVELSVRSLVRYAAGELFRITGKRDTVKKFLSACGTYSRFEEVCVMRSCTDENAGVDIRCTNTAVTVVHETSEEEWEFLKLVRFNEVTFARHPRVCILFDKPGSIHFSGDGSEVRKVMDEAYHCLDNRQVQTYYKSKAVVECLKLRWCKDLLQRKWDTAKIAATISVTEHNTAVIKCVGDLAIAMQILESTIKEARPIVLPEDFLLSNAPRIWAAIESAALDRATAVLDSTHRQIIVAGNVEQLSDVVAQILKLVKSGAPRDLDSRALTASSSIEDANRHSALDNSSAVRSEMDRSSRPSSTAELALEVTATAADAAEKAKVSTKSLNASERSPRDYNAGDSVSEKEQEAYERSQRRENEYEVRTTSMTNCSTAEANRDPENGRQIVGKELNIQRPNVPLSERSQDDKTEGHMYRNLHIQVIKDSVCWQKADVLVNTVFRSLDLTKGLVSKAFLHAAKPGLQAELYRKGPAKEFSLLDTESYGLSCSKVFHVVCGHYSNQQSVLELSKLVRLCLKTAESQGWTSIVFPPIGAGGLGYPIESVAEAFQDAVEDFNRQRPCRLKSVTCAIFDDETCKKFQRKLQALSQEQTSKRSLSQPYNDREPQQQSENFSDTAGVSAGESSYSSDITEKSSNAAQNLRSREIDRGVSKQAVSSRYNNDEPHSQERFSADGTSKGQSSLVLPGQSSVISDADLQKRIALQLAGRQPTYIRYLEVMGLETAKLLAIAKQSQEYMEVERLFSDCRRTLCLETVEISRIQDKIQWVLYSEQHEKMKKVEGVAVELQSLLWFSCPKDDVRGLVQSGHLLNRSTSIRQDYGKGTYFYRDAIDAVREQLSRAPAKETKCIILATVLTGHSVVGNPSMVALPQRRDSDRKYDSSVDKLNCPTIFVVYHDAQACPLYAVKFKATKA